MRDGRTLQIDRLAKRAPAFLGDKDNLVRLFIGGDEGAEKIRRNPPAPPTDAGHGPGDRFSQHVLFAEDGRQTGGEGDRQRRGRRKSAGPFNFVSASQIFAFIERRIFGAK